MKILLAVLLAAPVSASAQVFAPSQPADAISASVRSLRERLRPAQIDPGPVKTLFDRLSRDGEQIETQEGMQDAYRRFGMLDAHGKLNNLQVGVVERGDPQDAGAGPDAPPMVRDLVMRRVFSEMIAHNDEWALKSDGTGRLDRWTWTVALDGRILRVRHDIILVGPGPDGIIEPLPQQNWGYDLSPSDHYVQTRWTRLVKRLLTMGRVVSL
jgi:hypothetical protein